jgi:uncharacterized protein YxeA
MKNLIVNTIIIAIMIALGIIAINYINEKEASNPYTEICVKSEKTSELTPTIISFDSNNAPVYTYREVEYDKCVEYKKVLKSEVTK